MNSLDELNEWIRKIKNLEVNDNNTYVFNDFIRLSPEKIADKLKVEKSYLIREFNKHKKEIHRKLIIHKRIKVLKERKLDTFNFNYNNKIYKTKFCVCKKFLQIKSNAKFYPNITYLYCELEAFLPNEKLVVFTENQKVYITEIEFNGNFIDLREYKINEIINN